MTETWLLLNSGPGRPAWNMALDEALLEAAVRLERPVLRFYGWTEPAATFGYAQRYRDVSLWTRLRPLVRRPTGGGLVPHDRDWTYSVVIPPHHPWHKLKAVDSYRRIHEWLHSAFMSLGVSTQLSSVEQKPAPGQCFIGAEKFDLLRNGAKIAGAAQRRNRQGLLIQGSVQPGSPSLSRADWEKALTQSVPWAEGVLWKPLRLDGELVGRATQLETAKYSQPLFNERR